MSKSGQDELAPETMSWRPAGWNVTVPAGRYFLGDPCYAVPDESWDALLGTCGGFLDAPVGMTGLHQVLGFLTRWGDGRYRDHEGHAYLVDSGVIGLTPEAVYSRRPDAATLENAGRITEFGQAVTATAIGGQLQFGWLRIETDPDPYGRAGSGIR
jgi:hypothetical protein